MTARPFRAFMLEQSEGKVSGAIKELSDSDLPSGEVTVAVQYSTVNYKDGMILSGLGRLVRNYPHVPGIDFAGTVEESSSPAFRPGDLVVLTGWRVGETRWGGYAQRARVDASMLVRLPVGLTPLRAMAVGTAGFTSMLAIMALEAHGINPSQGEVLVTGASGGVGSVAVAILAKLGYSVAASTGRPENADYLRGLGATNIIDRNELAAGADRPLQSERWAGAVDTVGGTTLATLLTQLKYRGSVAACGLVAGNALNTTIVPFLLRGVNLLGIDSVMCPIDLRKTAWERLARELPLEKLDQMTTVAKLADLPRLGQEILNGKIRGRAVVDVNA